MFRKTKNLEYMKELKCPKCGTMFTVDEADFNSIVSQVRNQEFAAEVKKREQEIRDLYATREQMAKQQAETQLQQSMADKDREILRIQTEMQKKVDELQAAAEGSVWLCAGADHRGGAPVFQAF